MYHPQIVSRITSNDTCVMLTVGYRMHYCIYRKSCKHQCSEGQTSRGVILSTQSDKCTCTCIFGTVAIKIC